MTHEQTELELLTSLALGQLDDKTAQTLQTRLAAEPELRRRYESLRDSVRFLQSEAGTEVSAKTLKSAKRLLRDARPGVVEKLTEGLRQIVAALDFDTRLTPAVAGIRGAGSVAQVAFSCVEADLDLEITAGGDDLWNVSGQIDADEDGDWTVTIVDDAGTALDITIDARDGAFRVTLPAGSYEMLLCRGDLEIKASPLQIP